ncbi:hypothetical protein E2562_008004 [Oryza meyeriana var. granulata]|uniref:Uncharacterized protein n=1 Tax=Oryza meyeriana var. granulata TaxID=110450 RepID=A0A6G1DHR5_9ORYZ|nr:hypothetical protein E2562_008004 [Oryza meyeriana var. granulata]
MTEPPEMRWALIRKIYIILSIRQLLTTAVVIKVLELAGNAARAHTHARPLPLASLRPPASLACVGPPQELLF